MDINLPLEIQTRERCTFSKSVNSLANYYSPLVNLHTVLLQPLISPISYSDFVINNHDMKVNEPSRQDCLTPGEYGRH